MSGASIASVPTASGSRYLQQLCKHWAHKMPVEFDAGQGRVSFPSGAVAIMTAVPDALQVRIETPDEVNLADMQDVVARHLDRFAFREAPLAFDWRPA